MISESAYRSGTKNRRSDLSDNAKLSRGEVKKTIKRTVLKYLNGEIDFRYLVMMASILKSSDLVRSTPDFREIISSILSLSQYEFVQRARQDTINSVLIEVLNKVKCHHNR